jgi:Rad3-related DNA helicase
VIRTTEDRGVILLLDERFAYREYREQFPREWADARKITLKNAAAQIQAFWNGENML